MLYIVENLESAREFLMHHKGRVVITNLPASTRYYGMRVVDYMFKTLQQEFPDKIQGVVVDTYDDHSAQVTAIRLGYDL